MQKLLLLFFLIFTYSVQNNHFVAAQTANVTNVALFIEGKISKSGILKQEDFDKLEQHSAKVTAHNGKMVTYEGVSLHDILKDRGIPFGENLKGKNLTLFVLIEAKDGYSAVFSLTEFDPMFTDQVILLASKKDGKLLSEAEGTFRLIVPYEKRQSRWIRQVKTIKILSATD